MFLKRFLLNMILKLLLFLKRDMDLPRQRYIFQATMRKSVKSMDRDQLGQLIRFNGHFLDKATKCVNTGEGRGQGRAELLEKAVTEWESRGYPLGPDKIWAKKLLDRYKVWCGGKGCLLEPCQEPRKARSTDLFKVIQNRRSVRFWKRAPVEKKEIINLINAAIHAPSSCNRMPWRFFVVENDLNNIVEGDSTNQSMLEKAPIKIYVGIDERLYPEVYAPALDAGFASQNIVLAAHALGLDSCLMYQCESINQKILKTELHIPNYFRIYCVVLLGYPDEIPLTPGRILVEEVCTFTKVKLDQGL